MDHARTATAVATRRERSDGAALPNSEDPYQLTGTVNGLTIPPTSLMSFAEGLDSDGETSASTEGGVLTVQILLREQVLKDPSLGKRAMLLYHEAYHAALAALYFDFCAECPDCEHQVVHASTAAALCALANQCDPPLDPPLNSAQKYQLQVQSDSERKKCEEMAESDPCGTCSVTPKPPIPACPGSDCLLQECE
jgi:hypothetical protein